jgi:hypothetical protein
LFYIQPSTGLHHQQHHNDTEDMSDLASEDDSDEEVEERRVKYARNVKNDNDQVSSLTISSINTHAQNRTPAIHAGEWPVYDDKPIDYTHACDIILGVKAVPQSVICTSVPQMCKCEATFIIDTAGWPYEQLRDIAQDGLGSWGALIEFFFFVYALRQANRAVAHVTMYSMKCKIRSNELTSHQGSQQHKSGMCELSIVDMNIHPHDCSSLKRCYLLVCYSYSVCSCRFTWHKCKTINNN